MLTGQLEVLVQGKDRRCQVKLVDPKSPKQKEEKFPVNHKDEAFRVDRRLLELIEKAEPGGGWKKVCDVEFEENEYPLKPRFCGFRPVGVALEEMADEPREPSKIVTLEVTIKPKNLADRLAVSTTRRQQATIAPVQVPELIRQDQCFRNPYNFIPTPPRRFDSDNRTPGNPLGDHQPSGWDRLRPDLYTGWIDVELQVVTPLLTCDPETAALSRDDHRTFNRVLVDAQGLPRLEPTSLRGMLSSAYETITHGRLRVFGHDKRLDRRMPAQDGLATVPFRVERDEQGRLVARLLTGFADRLPQYNERRGQWVVDQETMLAAFVPMYGPAQGTGIPTVTPDRHGTKVWARIGLVRRNSPGARFSSWVVLDWNKDRSRLSTRNDGVRLPNRTGAGEFQEVEGWLCVTNQNINRKKYERLFFHESSTQYELPLQDTPNSGLNSIGRSWLEVIDAYREAHTHQELWNRRVGGSDKSPTEYLGDDPGKTAWSGHIYRDGSKEAQRLIAGDQDWAELREGTLGYVYLDREGRARTLIPVHIARYPFSYSPLEQLHESLHPAKHCGELSAADRVFGWVARNDSGSHRGQLRITDTVCRSSAHHAIRTFDPPVPLSILSTPKPKQTRFYLADDILGTPHVGTGAADDFSEDRSLRGRKVYPHHAGLPTGFWNVPSNRQPEPATNGYYREYLKAGGPDQQRSNQNRSIRQWVNPGTRFTFRIYVTNLNAAELGGLLWMLSRNEDPQDANSPVHFRYGGGKPLGFGSCELRIQGTSLHKGSEWSEAWSSLAPVPCSADPERQSDLRNQVIQVYQEALLGPFAAENSALTRIEQLPMIAAWLRAARGSNDGAPTHYPRRHNQPSRDDENYRWFDPGHGAPRPVLPSILKDDRLEY